MQRGGGRGTGVIALRGVDGSWSLPNNIIIVLSDNTRVVVVVYRRLNDNNDIASYCQRIVSKRCCGGSVQRNV